MWGILNLLASRPALADAPLANWGDDPFFQISESIPDCLKPLGPLQTKEAWLNEAHYRVERGNSCWVEGRCRLSNAYRYDGEIAETVQRRLTTLEAATHMREKSTLWLMLQRRFIYVLGCVSPDFDKQTFLLELGKTADVDKVIDNTTIDPQASPLPYRTPAHPDQAPSEPEN